MVIGGHHSIQCFTQVTNESSRACCVYVSVGSLSRIPSVKQKKRRKQYLGLMFFSCRKIQLVFGACFVVSSIIHLCFLSVVRLENGVVLLRALDPTVVAETSRFSAVFIKVSFAGSSK
jgi:hypothetical protein